MYTYSLYVYIKGIHWIELQDVVWASKCCYFTWEKLKVQELLSPGCCVSQQY